MTHLAWPQLPKAAWRFLVLQSLIEATPGCRRVLQDDDARRLVDQALALSESVATGPAPGNLVVYLRQAGHSALQNFSHYPDNASAQAVKAALSVALKVAIEKAGRVAPDRPIKASPLDPQNAYGAADSDCLALVRNIVDASHRCVEKLYTAVGVALRDFEWGTAHFSPITITDGLAIRGLTKEGMSSKRYVELSFEIPRIGIEELMLLPYLVMHELLVHVACGVALGSGTSRNSDAYHDGWMDMVCIHFYLAALRSGGLNEVVRDSDRNLASEICQEKHLSRRSLTKSPNKYARLWDLGAESGTRLRVLMGKTFDTPIGDTLFHGFSLLLNASAASDDLRQKLVLALEEGFNDDPAGVFEVGVVLAIREFAVDQDALKLAKAIVELIFD